MIKVLFFGSLGEQYQSIDEMPIASEISAQAIWQQITQQNELPENVLIAVNHEYVKAEYTIKDNDYETNIEQEIMEEIKKLSYKKEETDAEEAKKKMTESRAKVMQVRSTEP